MYYCVTSLLAYTVLNRIVYGLSKKKMPYLHLIDEAIGLLNTEIRLIEWRIKYPEQLHVHARVLPRFLTVCYA